MPLKNGSVSGWMRPCAGTISFEHIIGVSVRATTPEKKIAAASVMRELAEQPAGVAGHEGERHEHRHQRRGRGDDREADLAGAVEGGEQRRLAVLDAAVDVLDLDDGVVDDDADGEHDGEQRQHVDRGAEEAITMKEAMIETGIATMATMVERQSRRKRRMTRMTRATPSTQRLAARR